MFEYGNKIVFIKLHTRQDKAIWIRVDQIEAVAESTSENETFINVIHSESPYVVKESVDEIMNAISGSDKE